jgi:hypothetical protein
MNNLLPPAMNNLQLFANQQPQGPVFTDAEKDILGPIVMNQYTNMTPVQKSNMDNPVWYTIVNGYPDIRIARRPSGNGSKNIVIRRQIADNYVGPYDILFNIPLEQRAQRRSRGGKKSKRKKSRKLRKSRRR